MQGKAYKIVKKIVTPPEVSEGNGARVRRILGSRGISGECDPFLMLDHFRGKLPVGFPDHPHRGFETVSYLLKGTFYHEDFLGNKGILQPGDIQWITAGRGILHSEMPGSWDEESEGFQLWINLQAKFKMDKPSYQELKANLLPKIKQDGVNVVLIAGDALGQKGPIYARTPAFFMDFQLEQGATHEQEIPSGWNALVYVYEGEAYFGQEKKLAKKFQAVQLSKEQAQILLVQTKTGCSFMLIGGEPINEPVVQHGPFVMNTQEEIYQAFDDFQKGKNGFENAPNWESSISHLADKRPKK